MVVYNAATEHSRRARVQQGVKKVALKNQDEGSCATCSKRGVASSYLFRSSARAASDGDGWLTPFLAARCRAWISGRNLAIILRIVGNVILPRLGMWLFPSGF
jgi:hypothetical protein